MLAPKWHSTIAANTLPAINTVAWRSAITGPGAEHADAGGHSAVTAAPASHDDDVWQLPGRRSTQLNGLQQFTTES